MTLERELDSSFILLQAKCAREKDIPALHHYKIYFYFD